MSFNTKEYSNAYFKEYRKREDYKKKHAKLNKTWIENNRDRYNASKYSYRDRVKMDVLNHYANGEEIKCAQCGITDVDVLCLDHINNDGAEHRKSLGISCRGNNSGTRTYEALKKAGYPEGIQILCANCNMKKEMTRKRETRMKNLWYTKRGGDAKLCQK